MFGITALFLGFYVLFPASTVNFTGVIGRECTGAYLNQIGFHDGSFVHHFSHVFHLFPMVFTADKAKRATGYVPALHALKSIIPPGIGRQVCFIFQAFLIVQKPQCTGHG